MDSDCYATLGVARDANPSQIRRAFRTRFRQLHPDRAGPPGAARFDALRDAYDTLRDVARRADHDRQLLAREARAASEPDPGLPLMPAVDLFHSFEDYKPSRHEVLRVFMDNYTGRLPKSRPVHALNVDLVLSPDQAGAGGVVPFQVPVARPCDRCAGTGRTGFFHCDICEGHGVSWSVARLDIILPAGVPDGTNLPVSMNHLGVRSLFLNVQVRVADTPS
jgi:molecular chaperone DnaJ